MPARADTFAILLLGGLLGAAAGVFGLPGGAWPAAAVLAGLMAAIAYEDLRRLRISDVLNAATAIGGVALIVRPFDGTALSMERLAWTALNVVLCGGFLLAVREFFYRVKGIDGLGLGDVKLAAAAATWLNWDGFVKAILLASIAGFLFILGRAVVDRRLDRQQPMPFGFVFAPAIWLSWFAERLFGAT